jgi:hypothetical protein
MKLKRKVSKLVCAILVALMTISMLPALTVIGITPPPQEIGFVLAANLTDGGTTATVTLTSHFGVGLVGTSFFNATLTLPSGLHMPVAPTRHGGWDPTTVITTFTSPRTTHPLTFEATSLDPGAAAGLVATFVFTNVAATAPGNLVFSIAIEDNEAFDSEWGEVPVSANSVLTATIVRAGDPTPTIASITGATGDGPAAGGAVNATFNIVGANLTAAALATNFTPSIFAGSAFVASGGTTVNTPIVVGDGGTTATVVVPLSLNANTGFTDRDIEVALASTLTPSGTNTRAVITQAGNVPPAPGAGVPVPRPPVVQAGGAFELDFTVTGTALNNALAGEFSVIIGDAWLTQNGAITLHNVTAGQVTVRVPLTAAGPNGAALRTTNVTLQHNATNIPGAVATITQAGDGVIGTMLIGERHISQSTATASVPVYLTSVSSGGLRDIHFRVDSELPITGIVPNAYFTISSVETIGAHTYIVLSGGDAATEFAASTTVPMVTLTVNTSSATSTGGPLSNGVYPITNVAFVNRFNENTPPTQGPATGFGTPITITPTPGAVIVGGLVYIGDMDNSGTLTSRDITLLAQVAINGMGTFTNGTTPGTLNVLAGNIGCTISPTRTGTPSGPITAGEIQIAWATTFANYLVGQTLIMCTHTTTVGTQVCLIGTLCHQ